MHPNTVKLDTAHTSVCENIMRMIYLYWSYRELKVRGLGIDKNFDHKY